MAQASVLSKHQFSGKRQLRRDPISETRKPKFSGAEGSKTMTIAGGRVPRPPAKHPHHRKAGRRTKRIR